MKFGWLPDKPDNRDHHYVPNLMGLLPKSVDLRPHCPPVYDQGELGSCTANAVAGHLDFNRAKQGEALITPSRLFIYYNERSDQGTVNEDAGATIRESVKTIVKKGACPESEWPYDISMFTKQPSSKAYQDAVKYEALKYLRLNQDQDHMKQCLAEGYPFICGISVYESFMQSEGGNIPMPQKGEQLMGGHAVMIVGYTEDHWIMRNSWGESWGDKGYCYLPAQYLLDKGLAHDMWTLRKVK